MQGPLDPGIYPNVAKAGGLQSQGVEGEAVVVYREPLTTPDLMSSGLSRRVNNMAKSIPSFELTWWNIQEMMFSL